jgi:hypothetical protein
MADFYLRYMLVYNDLSRCSARRLGQIFTDISYILFALRSLASLKVPVTALRPTVPTGILS